MPNLTIAIPTFNRNEKLAGALRSLLVQTPPGVKVLILDNNSDRPVSVALANLINAHPEVSITIVRNVANIGVGANLLRGFENCQTDWIWFLTDKAIVKPGGVDLVLRTIEANRSCVFINFEVEMRPLSSKIAKRSLSIVTTGRQDMINHILYFGSVIDQMALVYHVPRIKSALHIGYFYIYASTPQLAIVLATLGPHDKCFFSAEEVAVRPGTPPAEQWSTLLLMQGCMSLLNLPLSPSERLILERKILEFLPNMRHYVAKFLIMATRGDPGASYYYTSYANLLKLHDHRPSTRIRLAVATLLMKMPALSLRILETLAQRRYGRSLFEAAERWPADPASDRKK